MKMGAKAANIFDMLALFKAVAIEEKDVWSLSAQI